MRRSRFVFAASFTLAGALFALSGCSTATTDGDTAGSTADGSVAGALAVGSSSSSRGDSMASTFESLMAGGRGMPEMGQFAGRPRGVPFIDEMNLTADQQTQAKAIFEQAHTDIDALHKSADDQIRALLTQEQLDKLDSRPGPGGRRGGPPPFARGPGGPRHGPDVAEIVDRMATDLSLTDDQKAQVTTIMTDSKTAIEARHDQAKVDFRPILTAEQVTTLDGIEAIREGAGLGIFGSPPHDGFEPGMRHVPPPERSLASDLTLTSDQSAQAKSIFEAAHIDVRAAHDATRQAIRDLLTDERKAILDAPPAERPPHQGHGFGGHGFDHPRADNAVNAHVGRLTELLGLTAEQQASVSALLSDVETSTKARRDQALADFRALLTTEQAAALDGYLAANGNAE